MTGDEREEPHGPRGAGEGTAGERPDEDVRQHGRRGWLKRGLQASGLVVVGVGTVGIVEADRGDEGGRPLHTEVYGPTSGRAMDAASTVVFLPGIGATTRYFRDRVQTLAANARVVLVDLLGFGQSPKPWATYSVERHVAELHRVLGGLGSVTLVGHSLGARIAVAYAARHPAQVQRLILIGVPYFGGGERARQYFRRRGAEGWFLTHLVPFAIMCLLSRRLLGWAFPTLMPDLPRGGGGSHDDDVALFHVLHVAGRLRVRHDIRFRAAAGVHTRDVHPRRPGRECAPGERAETRRSASRQHRAGATRRRPSTAASQTRLDAGPDRRGDRRWRWRRSRAGPGSDRHDLTHYERSSVADAPSAELAPAPCEAPRARATMASM